MNGQIIFATITNLVELRNADTYSDEENDSISKTIGILVEKLNETVWAKENGYKFKYWYSEEDDAFEVYDQNGLF